ncbi:MAG: hypothetical protein ACPGJI_01090 [Kangiellaceae bacterium]
MDLFSDKILQLKPALIKVGITLYVLVYLRLGYVTWYDLKLEIKWHQGIFSFGASTASSWFLTFTVLNLLIIVFWLRNKIKNNNY